MNAPYPIIDVDFYDVVEDLDAGLAVYEADVTLENGETLHGRIIGDGHWWDSESFEETL